MKLEKDIVIPAELEINPYTYLDIVLKYEPYLKLLYKFGGYMFLRHVYKFSDKGELQTFKDIHSMEKSKLLKIINVNSNSYVLLTKSSIKYLKNKPNVAYLSRPTSTQLKTCCYLCQYVSNSNEFFNPENPYNWFLNKYKNEIDKYKNKDKNVNMDFLIKNKEIVKRIKEEQNKSRNCNDIFSKLNTSRIYFDCIIHDIVNILILDLDRTKFWIYKAILEKIEPIFSSLLIYKGYNIKILTRNENREKRLIKDIKNMNCRELKFLKQITVVNLNVDTFFQPVEQKESFLKDIDKIEIAKLKEKLKSKEVLHE